MIGTDTGFLLALCQPRDALHAQAQAWAAVVAEPLLVTEYVLWETVNALSQPADRAKAHALLAFVRQAAGYEIVPASTALFDQGLHLHKQRPDKAWSLTDCISFCVFADRGIVQVLAHDHHFEQAGFQALLRHSPP